MTVVRYCRQIPVMAPMISSLRDVGPLKLPLLRPCRRHLDPVGHRAQVVEIVTDHQHRQPQRARAVSRWREHLRRLHRRRATPSARRARRCVVSPASSGRSRLPAAARRTAARAACAATARSRRWCASTSRTTSSISCAVEKPVVAALLPQVDVRGDVEVVADTEILEHRRDTVLARRGRAAQLSRCAVDLDIARVRLEDARDHLRQRRLARRVVADERHHLAGVDLQGALHECLHGAESLAARPATLRAGPGRSTALSWHGEAPMVLHVVVSVMSRSCA